MFVRVITVIPSARFRNVGAVASNTLGVTVVEGLGRHPWGGLFEIQPYRYSVSLEFLSG